MLEPTRQAIRTLVQEQISEADAEGQARYGGGRQVTPRQEMAYRLCHHEFFGLSPGDAAETMGTTLNAVRCLLSEVRCIAPQLFPVLRPKTAKIYEMFAHDGYTVSEIACELEIRPKTVYRVLRRMYSGRGHNGLHFRSDSSRRLRYCEWMDSHVRTKW